MEGSRDSEWLDVECPPYTAATGSACYCDVISATGCSCWALRAGRMTGRYGLTACLDPDAGRCSKHPGPGRLRRRTFTPEAGARGTGIQSVENCPGHHISSRHELSLLDSCLCTLQEVPGVVASTEVWLHPLHHQSRPGSVPAIRIGVVLASASLPRFHLSNL